MNENIICMYVFFKWKYKLKNKEKESIVTFRLVYSRMFNMLVEVFVRFNIEILLVGVYVCWYL